jgi:tetratricopeptide (TPR) repeat protein
METEQKEESRLFQWIPLGKVLSGVAVLFFCGYECYISWQYDTAIEKGHAFMSKKNYSFAIKEFDIASGYDNSKLEPILDKAQALSAMKRYNEAFETIKPLTTRSKVTAHALYDAAVYAYYADSTEFAYTFIRASIEKDSTDGAAWYLYGDIFAEFRNYDSAMISYQKALALGVKKPENIWVAMANALDNNGKFDSAMIYYQKAITANPNNANAYYHQGIALNTAGRKEQAVESFRRARTLGSQNAGEMLKKLE